MYFLLSPSLVSTQLNHLQDILLGHPSQTRHSLLHRWGFTCTCPLCSLPAPEKQASDIRRTLIARLEPKIIELASAGQISQAIDLAMESVEMILDEGDLESLLTDEYAMLAMLWLEKGDREKAEMWGRKAWKLLGDLGYLGNGAEENEEKFSLEVLLEGIGGLGGNGKERGWRRGGS